MEQQPQRIDDCINQLREAIEELEKFRLIVDTAEDAVITVDENQEVVFMNRTAEKMFGYAREELLGGDMSPLIPKSLRKSHHSYIDRVIKTGRQHIMGHPLQLEAQHRDGHKIPVHLTFSVAEVDGQYLFTAIMRDLSEKKGLTEKIKRAENLATVGQMVATVGHEVRQPLTSIGGFARQLTKETQLSEHAKRKLQIIVDEVARLERMLGELNDLSRPVEYNWNETDMGEVLDDVLEGLTPEITNSNAHLTISKDDDVPLVMADKDRLGQVVRNLLVNAMQAAGDEPVVGVSVGLGPDETVRVQVRDKGPGIAEETLKKVFQPFFTTKKGGTGLGLAVAKRIIGDHDGFISLENDSNGAVATILLPRTGNSKAPQG